MNENNKKELLEFINEENSHLPKCFQFDPRLYVDKYFYLIHTPEEIKKNLIDYSDSLLLENYKLKQQVEILKTHINRMEEIHAQLQ